MSEHNVQEPMDPGDLECKHRVFLCHSGAQKGFVEQLDKDLRRVDRYPFFDKDRESLPIGDNFPSLIFQAIKCCQVGVVFLSEEFFKRGPWPMFEVVEMVECGRRIMPIFLGISPGDLSKVEKVAEWKSKWEVWAKSNRRVNVARWESTLRSLRPLNGLVYNDVIGEVKFREEIVKEVCKIVPPFHVWNDSHVQGRSRISELIRVKISETPMSENGLQVVSLYGVGGIGKTTACKSFCKDRFLEFDGRVCHIEFGDGTSEVDRVREVLKRLTDTDNEFLKARNLDECWSRLEDLVRLKKVVLAIDNVSLCQKICDEVGKYLSLEYARGSVMMVTARGLGELEKLGLESENCHPMPELMEDEARTLFLYFAKLNSAVHEGFVMGYVNQCYFGKGDSDGSRHYHPLALKVVGSQMVGIHSRGWKSHKDDDSVFSVLRRSFDSLKYEHKMLFMDVALFDDRATILRIPGRINPAIGHKPYYTQIPCYSHYQWLPQHTSIEWLSIVHGISVDEVKERLNVLKERALLEELGDGRGPIGMHDLWREFAVMETKRGKEDEFQWVHENSLQAWKYNAELNEFCVIFDKIPSTHPHWMSGGGWNELRRISIQGCYLRSLNFRKCLKVTVLRLVDVIVANGGLDLSHLESVKSLEIDNEELQPIQVSGIGQLLNLAVLVWLDIKGESMSAVKEISCLTNLQILHLTGQFDTNYKPSMSLDLRQLRYLQDVRIYIPGMVSISGFTFRMKGLRILDLGGCYKLRRCRGVGDVDGLEVLLLGGCWELQELPNLQKLVRLQILDIHGCKFLKPFRGLGSLVSLQVLDGGDACLAMKELPSMINLAKLEVLDLWKCYKLKCIPGLGNLVALRKLRVCCQSLHDLPDCGKLTKLQSVEIYGSKSDDCKAGCGVSGNVLNLAMFESVSSLEIRGVDHELSNLSKLTALKSLYLFRCKLLELPDLQHFPQLRRLYLSSVGENVAVQSHGIHKHLETLDIISSPIRELPDLGQFPSLQSCRIWRCKFLTNLAISERLSALTSFHLRWCTNLRTVPDIDLFPSLTEFSFEQHEFSNELQREFFWNNLDKLKHQLRARGLGLGDDSVWRVEPVIWGDNTFGF